MEYSQVLCLLPVWLKSDKQFCSFSTKFLFKCYKTLWADINIVLHFFIPLDFLSKVKGLLAALWGCCASCGWNSTLDGCGIIFYQPWVLELKHILLQHFRILSKQSPGQFQHLAFWDLLPNLDCQIAIPVSFCIHMACTHTISTKKAEKMSAD